MEKRSEIPPMRECVAIWLPWQHSLEERAKKILEIRTEDLGKFLFFSKGFKREYIKKIEEQIRLI